MTEGEIIDLLRQRYGRQNGNGREWAFLSHVRSTTGFASGGDVRTADALAMSMYRSKRHVLHGFEVKVSRSDWLRELKDPSKSVAIASYCDYWWLAVSEPEVVKAGELPPKWGLLVATKGRPCPDDWKPPAWAPLAPWPGAPRLRVVTKPKQLEPKPLERDFVACVLRRFSREQEDAVAEAARQGAIGRLNELGLRARFASLEGATVGY